jgi:S1-C subfamily serine protease
MDADYAGRPRCFGLLTAIVILIALAGECAFADPPAASYAPARRNPDDLFRAIRDAAKSVVPTVVTIEALHGPRSTSEWLRAKNEHSQEQQVATRKEQPEEGAEVKENYVGSGLVLDQAGIILTNYHLVVGADAIIVRLPDGDEFRAEDVRGDGVTDLAIVRISPSRALPAATLGDSDEIEVGDPVVLIGNPFCLERSVSAGIVSATNRKLEHNGAYLIQTDACSNPGNSGGPLVDDKGQVIGIVEGAGGEKGVSQGLNFAIPINVAKRVADELLQNGRMIWPVIGADSQPLTPRIAECIGIPKDYGGALLTDIVPGMPAERAGLQPGDVVTRFAGRRVRNPIKFQAAIHSAPLDAVCHVQLLRNGEPITKAVELEPYSMPLAPMPHLTEEKANSATEMIGLTVSEIERPDELGYEGCPTGALITNVRPRSPAFYSDLRAGMIIRRVNRTSISTTDEYEAAIAETADEKSVLMLISTPQGSRFIVVQK